MKPKLIVTPDPEKLAFRAAEMILESARESIQSHGRFALALAGGSTPRRSYQFLASPDFLARIPWEKTDFFWGDERCVPPDDPQSNYLMAKEAMLGPLGISEEHIHRMAGELEPVQAAAQYHDELARFFSPADIRFDLVLLGLGDDGHTASLFPHTSALHTQEAVAANYVDKLDTWRITLSAKTINAARRVVFLVAGENKARVLAKVIEGSYLPEDFPSQVIAPEDGELIWLVDQAAASLLSNK